MSNKVYLEPSYASDERNTPGFVRVIVAVPNLVTCRKLSRQGGLFPKVIKIAENFNIIQPTFQERSFELRIESTDSDPNSKHYMLNIKKLPREIIPDTSHHKIENGRVLLFLAKKTSESWYPELESGLETWRETNEEVPTGDGDAHITEPAMLSEETNLKPARLSSGLETGEMRDDNG